MLRLLSRGRKAQEGGEDDPKKYKKANLGQSNQMYYNDELKMWVERGKEDEARAEKAKLNAPPPSVGSLSAASSTTSLATMDGAGPPPAPNFSRTKGLASRYVATPTLATAAPAAGAGSTPGGSPAIPGPKALLPGMGGPKLPGIPAAPGSGPPSFFRPTPAASEATSDAMGGSELGSVSGLSGLDAPGSFSRNTSQPNFFIPGAAPSSTTTEDTQGAGAAMDEGVRVSSGSSGTAATDQPRRDPSAAGSDAVSFRESDASASGRPPALSGPSNVSFASWQHISRDSGTGSPAAAAAAVPPAEVAGAAGAVGEELGVGQQGSSSPDTEADAEAEVSSPTPELYPGKQHVPHVSAYSNGNAAAAYGAGSYAPAAAGSELLANGNYSVDGVQPGGEEQPPLDTQLSAGWDSRPVKDPFDTGADPGMLTGPVSNGWAPEQDGYGWEGAGGWQQPQDPLEGGAVQQPDPLAGGGVEGGWAVQPDGQGVWGTQAAGAEAWGNGNGAAAGVDDPEGGGGAVGAATGDAGVDPAADSNHHQPGYYGQYAPATAGTAGAFGSYDNQQYHPTADSAAAGILQPPYAQQPYSGDTSSVPAEGGYYYPPQQPGQDSAAAYTGYVEQAAAVLTPEQQQQQDTAGVLQPVHPELPGISVAGMGSGGLASPTHPQQGPAPGSSRGSKAAGRHISMPGSPLTHQSSMGALLPGPPRHSVGGLSTQRSLGLQDLQGEAAAVVLSTTAAAGDASMLTTFRPSSPYARAVSPLSRTSTGVGDAAAVTRKSSGGFPIPSPPGHAGMLGGRPQSGGMFLPGGASSAQAAAGAPAVPWQPGSTAGAGMAHGADFSTQQPQQEYPLMNGCDPAGQSHWAHQHQPYAGNGYGMPGTPQQQHFGEPSPQQAAGSYTSGSGPPSQAPPVPPFVPGLLESLPRDALPSCPRDETAPYAPGQHQPAAAGGKGPEGLQQQHPMVAARSHPYDQFLSQALSQVNWRAVHFKQPGKLNRMLPWEEFEMEQALQQEAERQAAGHGRTSPFWFRQMEFRQKLPPGSMKPSASEPAAMPSHAANKAPPPSAAESTASQVSAYPGWPQVQEQQHQQALQQQYQAHTLEQPHGQQQQVPGSPLTPAKAATDGALGAVAAGGADLFHEEPTPTSKFMQPSEQPAVVDGELQGVGDATAAAAAGSAVEQQQPGWEGYSAEQQPAVNGYWTQDEYGQQVYVQQPYNQHYGQQQYDQYGQPYSVEQQPQQYDMSQWQQQPAEQQCISTTGEAAAAGADQAGVQGVGAPEGWSMQSGQQATWGSPEPQADTQQQYQGYPAAAVEPQHQGYVLAGVEEAAGAWGVDETLDLQLGVVAVDGAADAAVALAAPAAATVVDAAHSLHSPEVMSAARAARISSSSLGLESQPSTGRVAAAAAKRIVSSALESIMQQHAVPEEQSGVGEQGNTEAAVDGWEGGEVAVDGQESVGEVDAAEDQQEPGAEEAGEEGVEYGAAAAAPVSAAWLKLAQQFNAAADAAAAMGSLDPELSQYREYFVTYGDYLLGALPREALEQAGLLADDAQAAGDEASGGVMEAQQQEQDEADGEEEEEDEDLYAEFGNLQLRDDTSAGLFASLGFDIDSLMACCAGA